MSDLQFVSLFSGAGGLDLGFELAGWTCRYASDHDESCVNSLLSNASRSINGQKVLTNCAIERADVKDLTGRDILSKAGLRRGQLAALVGGPPCQSWSSAGHQLGFEDPRGRVIREYIRIAAELDVRWLVFENVRGLLTARGADEVPGSALHYVRSALLEAGFHTEVNLLNAADYGVPQRRVRLFMIGFRKGDRPSFPDPTHSRAPDLLQSNVKPWKTLREGINGIAPLTSEEIVRPSPQLSAQLACVPPGSGLRSPGKHESTRPSGHWGYKQGCFVADFDQPARTVTASTQQDWIRDPHYGLRRLAPRECAALQSFPASWCFIGNKTAQYRQIGNAVPVELALALGQSLALHVATNNRFRRSRASYTELLPLNPRLVSAIEYTRREQIRNGESRRSAPSKRLSRPRSS